MKYARIVCPVGMGWRMWVMPKYLREKSRLWSLGRKLFMALIDNNVRKCSLQYETIRLCSFVHMYHRYERKWNVKYFLTTHYNFRKVNDKVSCALLANIAVECSPWKLFIFFLLFAVTLKIFHQNFGYTEFLSCNQLQKLLFFFLFLSQMKSNWTGFELWRRLYNEYVLLA